MARLKANIRSYEDAAAYLGSKASRPLGHNTRIEYVNGAPGFTVRIFLHDTAIVTLESSGSMYLNSGGWRTSTTKERLNQFLPAGLSLYQERGQWWLTCRGTSERWLFADGLTITGLRFPGCENRYAIANAGTPSDLDESRKIAKAIRAYVKAYTAALVAGEIPAPSGGDCWYCLMRDTASSEPLGETTRDTGHLLGHLGLSEDEPGEFYLVPSLLLRAFEVFPACAFSQNALAGLWSGHAAEVHDFERGILARDAASSLTAYLKRQFDMAGHRSPSTPDARPGYAVR